MHQKEKVLAIGAGAEQLYSIKTATDLGLEVIATDRDKNAAGFALSAHHYNIDTKDADAVLAIAQKHNVKAVIPACIGRYITTVGHVNEKMGLIGPKIEACVCCADKVAFNKILVSNALPAPYQIAAEKGMQINKLPPPVIAKPRYGSGSKNVKLISSQAEYDEYLETFGDSSCLGEPLLEEYIDGVEYGIDALIINSEIVFLNLRDKLITPLPYRQVLRYLSPSADKNVYECIFTALSRIAKTLKLSDTMLHADIIVDKNGVPHIIEMSPRPAGLNIVSKILPENTGRNMVAEWIRYQVWQQPIAPILMRNIVCLQFFPYENMTVAKTPDIQPIIQKYNVHDFECHMATGMNLKHIRNGNDLAKRGFFMITGSDYNEITERTEHILNEVRSGLL